MTQPIENQIDDVLVSALLLAKEDMTRENVLKIGRSLICHASQLIEENDVYDESIGVNSDFIDAVIPIPDGRSVNIFELIHTMADSIETNDCKILQKMTGISNVDDLMMANVCQTETKEYRHIYFDGEWNNSEIPMGGPFAFILIRECVLVLSEGPYPICPWNYLVPKIERYAPYYPLKTGS